MLLHYIYMYVWLISNYLNKLSIQFILYIGLIRPSLKNYWNIKIWLYWLIDWCLMPTLAVFQLYCDYIESFDLYILIVLIVEPSRLVHCILIRNVELKDTILMYFQYLSDKQASIPFINFNVFVLHATLVSVKKRDIGFVFLLTFIYFPTTIIHIQWLERYFHFKWNWIGVVVGMLAQSVVDHGFQLRSGETRL